MIFHLQIVRGFLLLGLAVGWSGWITLTVVSAESPSDESKPAVPLVQVFRPSNWPGGVEDSDGSCAATAGEYSYWVYATATRCGVPRAQADRVVSIRQPIPGMAPLKAGWELPSGRYAVWVYGSGQPGYPWVSLCAKTCARGPMPEKAAWVFLDWIEIRDNQALDFRTYRQPDGHRLEVQAIVISSEEKQPDWVP